MVYVRSLIIIALFSEASESSFFKVLILAADCFCDVQPENRSCNETKTKVRSPVCSLIQKCSQSSLRYQSGATSSVPIFKGEQYELISEDDGVWFTVRSADGMKGSAPSNFLEKKCDLESYEWYGKGLSKARCEMILQEDGQVGCFLLRNSVHQADHYALAVLKNKRTDPTGSGIKRRFLGTGCNVIIGTGSYVIMYRALLQELNHPACASEDIDQSAQQQADPCLCWKRMDGEVSNFLIEKACGKFHIGTRSFWSLPDFINHFRRNPLKDGLVLSHSPKNLAAKLKAASLLPDEILQMDKQALQLYKTVLEDGYEEDYSVRIMVVGAFGMGKTSFVKRLLFQNLDINERNSTDGIDVHVNTCKVSLETQRWIVNPRGKNDKAVLERLAKALSLSKSEPPTQQDISTISSTIHSDYNQYDTEIPGATQKEYVSANGSEENPILAKYDQNPALDGKDVDELSKMQKETSVFEDFPATPVHEELQATCTSSVSTMSRHLENEEKLRTELKDIVSNAESAYAPHNYASVSVWDFGGQSVFYTTHQMFLNHRSVYIVVNDMSKQINEIVMDDEPYFDCNGSHSLKMEDFLDIWLKSIHGHTQTVPGVPPVILVGTHADKLMPEEREKQMEAYFDATRNRFSGTDISLHFIDKDFGLSNATVTPVFEELRDKLIEVAKKQSYWGEKKPVKWIPFEKLLEDLKKGGIEIVSRKDVESLNSAMPVPITRENEVDLFLRFQHECGNIMYFSVPALKDKIVLSPQFLVDALKSIITAEMFCKKMPEIADQWKEFRQKGVLTQTLLDAVWNRMENRRFQENKDHILALMLHLNIIAKPIRYNEQGDRIDEEETEMRSEEISNSANVITKHENEKVDDAMQQMVYNSTDIKRTTMQKGQSEASLKESVVNWIAKTQGIDISAESFMDVLDNGVHICELANVIHKKAEECIQQGLCSDKIPTVKPRCNKNAQSGSWFARDNAANFKLWCQAFGFQEQCILEPEDLVSHKSERQVVITLLELAKLGYKYGLEPPSVIKTEDKVEQKKYPSSVKPPVPAKPKLPVPSVPKELNMEEEEKDFYLVPCMLREIPLGSVLSPDEKYISTTYLCLVLKNMAFPIPLFNRVLAVCLTRWPLAMTRKRFHIYSGCGQFDVDRQHRFTLMFSSNVIQLRVVRYCQPARKPDSELCQQIHKEILEIITQVAEGLLIRLEIEHGVKCPVEKPGSAECIHTLEELLEQDEFPCHKHSEIAIIHSSQMLEYWFSEDLFADGQDEFSCDSMSEDDIHESATDLVYETEVDRSSSELNSWSDTKIEPDTESEPDNGVEPDTEVEPDPVAFLDGANFNEPITHDHINHYRIRTILESIGSSCLREILLMHPPAGYANIYTALLAKRAVITGMKQLRLEQISLIFPDPQGRFTSTVDQFDITLLYCLIRNFSTVPAPMTGWGNVPQEQPRDVSLGANVERIRLFRNRIIGHSVDSRLNDLLYEEHCDEISQIIDDIELSIGNRSFQADLLKHKTQIIMPHEAKSLQAKFQRYKDQLREDIDLFEEGMKTCLEEGMKKLKKGLQT